MLWGRRVFLVGQFTKAEGLTYSAFFTLYPVYSEYLFCNQYQFVVELLNVVDDLVNLQFFYVFWLESATRELLV